MNRKTMGVWLVKAALLGLAGWLFYFFVTGFVAIVLPKAPEAWGPIAGLITVLFGLEFLRKRMNG